MKKGTEWLEKEIGELPCVDAIFKVYNDDHNFTATYVHSAVPVKAVYELIDQLDEPEILPQGEVISTVLDDLKEYIKEQQSLSQNVGMAHTPAGNDTHYRQYDYVLECINEYEPSKDLQNLLVPSQELPVIPKFVADWIEEVKPDNSLRVAFEYISQRKKDNHDDELVFWVEEGNSETFARAWLDGYTVEEEPLYRAKLKIPTNELIVAYLRTLSSDDKERLKALEIGSKYIHKDYRNLSEFTEEELKRLDIWDSDQWEIEELGRMKVRTMVTGADLTEGIRFYGDTHYDNESIERLKDLAMLLEDVFSELVNLERQVEDRSEGSAKEIKCLLEIMRNDLLWLSFGEEIVEEVVKLLEVED